MRLLKKRQDGKCCVAKCTVTLVDKPRNFIDEHRIPLALGGTNQLKNRELRCIAHAKSKTYGTGATTAGSDIGNINKVKAIMTGKMLVNFALKVLKKDRVRPKSRWPKRKMESRGWR